MRWRDFMWMRGPWGSCEPLSKGPVSGVEYVREYDGKDPEDRKREKNEIHF